MKKIKLIYRTAAIDLFPAKIPNKQLALFHRLWRNLGQVTEMLDNFPFESQASALLFHRHHRSKSQIQHLTFLDSFPRDSQVKIQLFHCFSFKSSKFNGESHFERCFSFERFNCTAQRKRKPSSRNALPVLHKFFQIAAHRKSFT